MNFDSLSKFKEFDNHRFVSFFCDPKTGLQGFIALHRGNGSNIPSFGATRFVPYRNLLDALKDSLKLSKLMSYKAALAGIQYGGAKGVILFNSQKTAKKELLLKAYAQKVSMLDGRFITGADVGISKKDVKTMSRLSPYFVGVSTDPVKYTALGLIEGIKVCLRECFGSEELTNRSFAIQGMGKIGAELLKNIYSKAGKIYVTDIDNSTIKQIKKSYPKIEAVDPKDIYKLKVDIFSPCALSNSLNSETVSKLRCKIIAGGANNQLESAAIGELIRKLGILYAPDYIVNAGGLISVVDEYEHKRIDEKRILKRVQHTAVTLNKVIQKSKATKLATNIIADQLAEEIFNNH
jgi:leucine dehydrogenase